MASRETILRHIYALRRSLEELRGTEHEQQIAATEAAIEVLAYRLQDVPEGAHGSRAKTLPSPPGD